jgi:hypothetical protein
MFHLENRNRFAATICIFLLLNLLAGWFGVFKSQLGRDVMVGLLFCTIIAMLLFWPGSRNKLSEDEDE